MISHGGCVAGVLEHFGVYDEDIGYPLTNINAF